MGGSGDDNRFIHNRPTMRLVPLKKQSVTAVCSAKAELLTSS
jgi:hypothetical protein